MTPAFVGAVALTLVLLVLVADLLAVHYARGVLQSAAEEGARQGAAVGTDAACRARADGLVRDGLGAMAGAVDPSTCTVGPTGATATLTATFAPWLPLRPTAVEAVRATALHPVLPARAP